MSCPTPPTARRPATSASTRRSSPTSSTPRQLGRIEVRFPSLGTDGDQDVRAWATLCTPYADDDQGLAILPEVGSQVVVAFEAGNLRRPYIVGCAWNGQAALPHAPEKANNIRLLRSRGDSRLEFDDTAGAAKVSITMKAGHQVVLDEATQEITIQHSNGCVLRMTATGAIEIDANSRSVSRLPRSTSTRRCPLSTASSSALSCGQRLVNLAGVHPRRREPLVNAMEVSRCALPGTSASATTNLRDARLAPPSIQMYGDTTFVDSLLNDPRDSLKPTARRQVELPRARYPRRSAKGRARFATSTLVTTDCASCTSPAHDRYYVVVVEVFCDLRGCRAPGRTRTSRSASSCAAS